MDGLLFFMSNRPPILILCIGNPLRGDDGVAHHVGAMLQPLLPATCRLIQDHQFFPEHADAMGEAQYTIIVDACLESTSEGDLRPFLPDPAASMGLHGMTLDALHALCVCLHGKAPDICLCPITAYSIDHSESLSKEAEAGAKRAVDRILHFVNSLEF